MIYQLMTMNNESYDPTNVIDHTQSPAMTSPLRWRKASQRTTHQTFRSLYPDPHSTVNAAYEDQVNRVFEEMNRGSDASSPSNSGATFYEPSMMSPPKMPLKRHISPSRTLYQTDRPRPRKPTNPPPINQPHHTLSRSPPPLRTNTINAALIDSSSPSAPSKHIPFSHLPPPSATDLARYNDAKLAPFPALLPSVSFPSGQPPDARGSTSSSNSTPSSNNFALNTASSSGTPTSLSDSPPKTILSPSPSSARRSSKTHGNSILASVSSFFGGGSSDVNRGRPDSTSSGISLNSIGQPTLIASSSTSFVGLDNLAGQFTSPPHSQSRLNYHHDEHVEEIRTGFHDSGSGPPRTHWNSPSSPVPTSKSLNHPGSSVSTSPHNLITTNISPFTTSPTESSAVPPSSNMSRSNTSGSSLQSHQSSTASTSTFEHRQRILQQLSPFLESRDLHSPRIPKSPSMLNQPPRKLRSYGPVLQVVNSTSVKDRYLFLFNDILVITKPIIEFEDKLSDEGERIPKLPITLQHQFLTKSVVELNKLECTIPRLDLSAINGQSPLKLPSPPTSMTSPILHDKKFNKPGTTLLQQFANQFEIDPEQALFDTIQRGLMKPDPSSISKLLFLTTNELNKKQLGSYLSKSENVKVLKSYLDRFKYYHCRIDDALRIFLLCLKLPNNLQAVEYLLSTFATQWSVANETLGINQILALKLVKAILSLNDVLHSSLYDSTKYVTSAFVLPTGAANSVQDFIHHFKFTLQPLDYNQRRPAYRMTIVGQEESERYNSAEEKVISDERLNHLLTKIYLSVQRDKVVQAKTSEEETERITVTNQMAELDPEGGGMSENLPNRLTYQISSGLITLSLPEPDSHFAIKLFSTGLKFEPPFLTFSKSRECSFRIIGRSLGLCNMSFIKIGSRASKYVGLPLSKTILVERAFMKDTLQITFMNHLKTHRKYLFSFDDAFKREEFIELVQHSQREMRNKLEVEQLNKKEKVMIDERRSNENLIARAAAMQVLRDTLIPNEEFMPLAVNPHTHTTISLIKTSKSNQPKKDAQSQNSTTPNKVLHNGSRIRSNSLSETYIFGLGSHEKSLQSAIIQKRMIAQQLHIKKKQQKLLQLQLRQNIEGGRAGLNPYSITHKELSLVSQLESSSNQHQNGGSIIGADGKTIEGGEVGRVNVGMKDEVELFQEKFLRNGDELITQCQQNSLIPLVLGFLSKGVVSSPALTPSLSQPSLSLSPLNLPSTKLEKPNDLYHQSQHHSTLVRSIDSNQTSSFGSSSPS